MSSDPQLDAIRERLKRCTSNTRHHHGMMIYGSVYIEDVTYLLSLLDEPSSAATQDEALAEMLLDAPGQSVQTMTIEIDDLHERLQRGETVEISSATWFPVCPMCGKRQSATVTGRCS